MSGFPLLSLLPPPFAHPAVSFASQHRPESARGPPGALLVIITRGQVWTPFGVMGWEQKINTHSSHSSPTRK